MEYFIIGSGVMLDQILDILKEKVKHGVVVRIIYDDFGSISHSATFYKGDGEHRNTDQTIQSI